jgi:hypothetical protein
MNLDKPTVFDESLPFEFVEPYVLNVYLIDGYKFHGNQVPWKELPLTPKPNVSDN